MLAGANTVEDSDSISCIAGAISGAPNGLGAIPARWRDEVENSEMLHKLATDLLAAKNRRQ